LIRVPGLWPRQKGAGSSREDRLEFVKEACQPSTISARTRKVRDDDPGFGFRLSIAVIVGLGEDEFQDERLREAIAHVKRARGMSVAWARRPGKRKQVEHATRIEDDRSCPTAETRGGGGGGVGWDDAELLGWLARRTEIKHVR